MPIAWPVTKAASSEARNAIIAATSSGLPKRPTGIALARSANPSSRSSPYSRRFVLIARDVRIGPGQTALTVIPYGATSKASDFVNPTIAALRRTGIVDEDVEPAVARHNLLDHSLGIGFDTDIAERGSGRFAAAHEFFDEAVDAAP